MNLDIAAFCKYLSKSFYSEETLLAYKFSLINLQKFLGRNIFKYEDLICWQKYMVRRYKPATVNLRINAIHLYLRWIKKPHYRLRFVPVYRTTICEEIMTEETYQVFLSSLLQDNEIYMYVLSRILAVSGMRLTEVFQLKLQHLEANAIELIGTKNYKSRRVFFPKGACCEMIEMIRANEKCFFHPHIFISENVKAKNLRRNIQRCYGKLSKRYGISPKVIHAHGFRHFFAKSFLKANADIVTLSELLGHANLETTRIYLRYTQKEQKDVVNQFVTW